MNNEQKEPVLPHMPDPEALAQELEQVTSMDDLVGKNGVFARMFGKTLSAMLEGELSAHLGYEKYEAKGRNSGNNRN